MNRIKNIAIPDKTAYLSAKKRWDSIAKPLGSFGELELMIQKIASIQHTDAVQIDKRTTIVFCADHGVVQEGVTQTGSEVTAICANAIAKGSSNVNAIANSCHAEVLAVDIGMQKDIENSKLLRRKVAYGTANFIKEPAMTLEQTRKALCIGMDIVRDLKKDGVQLLIAGEMGIGNTTPTSAIASVLLNQSPREVTGRGAGLSSEGLERKIHAIEQAIAVNHPDKNQPLELLSKLGGLEIAGMTGLFLGGAYYQIPVVIDGIISAVSAVLACQMNSLCAEYLLPSHVSGEPAGKALLQMIHLNPVIHAGLRLGEGTGGLLLLPLLDSALALYRNSHKFEDIAIERYTEQS